jgi:hypothetical protein
MKSFLYMAVFSNLKQSHSADTKSNGGTGGVAQVVVYLSNKLI